MENSKAYDVGVETGTNAAKQAENVDEAFAIELHSRQYSPFEQIAFDINQSNNPDKVWNAFDTGVEDAIHTYFNN